MLWVCGGAGRGPGARVPLHCAFANSAKDNNEAEDEDEDEDMDDDMAPPPRGRDRRPTLADLDVSMFANYAEAPPPSADDYADPDADQDEDDDLEQRIADAVLGMKGRTLSQDTLCFDSGDEVGAVFADDEDGADLKAMGFGMYCDETSSSDEDLEEEEEEATPMSAPATTPQNKTGSVKSMLEAAIDNPSILIGGSRRPFL